MVYCAAFDCNANSCKNNVTCSWYKFPSQVCLKKQESSRRRIAGFARFEKTCFDCDPNQRRCSPGLSCAKISLKEDDVPTLFAVPEAILMSPIRRIQAATRASTTTVYVGSK